MAEYIEREKLTADFELCNKQNPRWTPQRVASLIARAPAADVVEVVRCRDCKHHRIAENKKNFIYWHNCKLWCADIDEDDFCSYGERKDGADVQNT